MRINRSGNFGFIDTGNGLYSFHINAKGAGWEPTSMILGGRNNFFNKKMNVAGVNIVPLGVDNDLPGHVMQLLDGFYAGEGIMGKKIGLQWGEGPRLYRDAVSEADNTFYRRWVVEPEIVTELESFDYLTQMYRCLVDLVHLEGFWVKFVRNRAPRVGGEGRLLRVEHIPAGKVRFVYPPDDSNTPTEAMVGDFPFPDPEYLHIYPLFDPKHPFRHAVSVAYYNNYSFHKDFYSTPRYMGAFGWLELAGGLAGILSAYNANASAISLHIESPQSYWDNAEARIKEVCEKTGEVYTAEMLEEFKDAAMEKFASSMTGRENAGKFMHTSRYWSPEANNFEGWKITPVDKKIKDYIDAQIAISKKSDAAATSGFGLDPVLSNLILDSKLSSGSEKLYSLKVYNASETSIPDMILCKPFEQFLKANHPDTDLRIGLYRTVVEAEKNVSPSNRMKENA